jgi:DNA-binding NtrC family response regulator
LNQLENSLGSHSILLADDDDDIRLALELLLVTNGYRVIHAANAQEIQSQADREMPNLVLLDMNFSRDTTSGQEGLDILNKLVAANIPVILMTAWGSIELAVAGLKQGASDFIEKPWDKQRLLSSIEQQLNVSRIKQEHRAYRQLLSSAPVDNSNIATEQNKWICQSTVMQDIEQLIQQIAPTNANVLILGENGTGKSLLAERIHQLSGRHNAPLISVNMAAIPDNLFESELFGHQKGAFTDAKQQRIGRFQLAEKGSLFFDEIGSLALHLQPKLLRVLETGQYEILGSSQTQRADVRLISATNADLNQLVANKLFRQDLLYRLNTIVITMPSLQERLEDLLPLAEKLIQQFTKKYHKDKLTLSADALSKLQAHSWPGNIRQLSHVIERAVLLSTCDQITPQQLLLDNTPDSQSQVQLQSLEQAERQLIEKAMEFTSGNIIEASKILAISRNALYRRLEKHFPNMLKDEE